MTVPDAHAIFPAFGETEEGTENESSIVSTSSALVVSTRPEEWNGVIGLLEHHSTLYSASESVTAQKWFAIGIHPWMVKIEAVEVGNKATWELMRTLLQSHTALRVGEIGLDKSRKLKSSFELQLGVFKTQLHLAAELERSVSIHCVQSHGALLNVLKDLETCERLPKGIYLHSWSGSADITRDILRLKRIGSLVYFGVSMKINATKGEIISCLPRDRILAESDLMLDDPNRLQAMDQVVKVLHDHVDVEQLKTNFEQFARLMDG